MARFLLFLLSFGAEFGLQPELLQLGLSQLRSQVASLRTNKTRGTDKRVDTLLREPASTNHDTCHDDAQRNTTHTAWRSCLLTKQERPQIAQQTTPRKNGATRKWKSSQSTRRRERPGYQPRTNERTNKRANQPTTKPIEQQPPGERTDRPTDRPTEQSTSQPAGQPTNNQPTLNQP